MTNHPDETHTLRERVDEAISWFTGTDEPVEETPAEPVADQAPVEAVVPTEVLTHSAELDPSTGAATDVEPAAEPQPEPVDNLASAPADEALPAEPSEVTQAAPDAEPLPPVAPVVAAAADPVADQPVTDAPVAPDALTPEPAPVVAPVVPEAASPVAAEAPAPVATWPPVSVPMPATPTPTPTSALEPEDVVEPEAPVEPEQAVVAEPATAASEPVPAYEPLAVPPAVDAPVGVESSDVDEPTRIHPIDESLGVPVEFDSGMIEPVQNTKEIPQRSFFRDETPAIGMGVGALGGGAVGAAAAGAIPATEKTAVLDAQEAARLRREERAARDRQLGKVIASQDDDEPLVTPFTTPSTYKGLPSFGLFLFRVIVAAVVGIRAWEHITHLTATRQMWAATVMPSPGTVAWVQIIAEIAIAVMLVFGLGTRIAGLVLLVLSVVQLVFVQWGAVNPFQPNATDFIGVADVLLAGAGLLLATVGGGRAAIDGAIHVGHVRRKNSKLFA